MAQSHVLYREIHQITIAVKSMFKQKQNKRITTGIELLKSSNMQLALKKTNLPGQNRGQDRTGEMTGQDKTGQDRG